MNENFRALKSVNPRKFFFHGFLGRLDDHCLDYEQESIVKPWWWENWEYKRMGVVSRSDGKKQEHQEL